MALKIAAVVLAFIGFLLVQQQNAFAFNGEVFEITGSGTILHYHLVTATPGAKPPATKVTAGQIAGCIVGTDPSCTGLIQTDPDGKAYVYFFSSTDWGIATQPDLSCGSGLITPLSGLVAGSGQFIMAGQFTSLNDTSFLIQGTVSFTKGTLTPTGMKKASVLAFSEIQGHGGTGSVATVGAAVDNCNNH
jgi:hypothetical protein